MDRKLLIDILDDFAFGSHDIEEAADRIIELENNVENPQVKECICMTKSN